MRGILILLVSLGCCGEMVWARPSIVDDSKIIRNFQDEVGARLDAGDYTSLKELKEGLKSPSEMPEFPEVKAPESVLESVFVVGSVYDCGKCDKWHPAGLATAWVMAEDGILCTNYHVIANFKGEAMAVASWEGEIHLVTEILLADRSHDVAVFRIDTEGLVPLPLAKEAAAVGDKISCLSHPQQRFFLHTFGEVARYHMRRAKGPKIPQMAITADYAKGSSGGPILNESNEVVGMVSTTSSIYTGKTSKEKRDSLQMVMKNCVPGFMIQELVEESQNEKVVKLSVGSRTESSLE